MNNVANEWQAKPAARRNIGLVIGLEGPPGGGKTASALLLAQGIQRARPGPIILIDTERRANKYAGVKIGDGEPFKFEIVDFDPPFRASRYLEAIRAQLPRDPACIIVDTMSDEHEGEGGRLEWHEEELDNILKRQNSSKPNYDPRKDWAGRMAQGQSAWRPSSEARTKLANSLQRLAPVPIILTFRAREKTRPVEQQKNGRTVSVPTNIGYQPIAPADIVHAVDILALLPPKADGVPKWRSDKSTEDFVLKLPEQFRGMFQHGAPITAAIGQALGRWARGEEVAAALSEASVKSLREAEPAQEPQGLARRSTDLHRDARVRAAAGFDVFNDWFTTLLASDQAKVREIEPELQRLFDDYDARMP